MVVPVASLRAYAQALKQAWADGAMSRDEDGIVGDPAKIDGDHDQEQKV